MKSSLIHTAILTVLLAFLHWPAAQASLTPEQRTTAVEAIAKVIEEEYYDAQRAEEISTKLTSALGFGEFSKLSEAGALADELTRRLRQEDRHFNVRFNPQQKTGSQPGHDGHDEDRQSDQRRAMSRAHYGFERVEILPGNIGYIDLRMFAPIEAGEKTATAALNFLANTDAVIIDLRNNGGGSPSMVQFLISHFLNLQDPVIINTFVSRTREHPRQMWSLPSHPAGYRPDTPLFVLTSAGTGSAAEGFSYHLRAMERATLIGETTYGAGNPGDTFFLESGFSVFVSTGSARNPITKTNWEGTGVQPHIKIPADGALDESLSMLYQELEEATQDPLQSLALNWAGEMLAARRNPVSPETTELGRYAGDYGIRKTFIEEDRLMYQREGSEPYALVALGNHRFTFHNDNGYRIVFEMDNDGHSKQMNLLVSDGSEIPNQRID
jgi:hypothetical protein